MPNWCEGTLKIKGKTEDILSFLNNECLSNNKHIIATFDEGEIDIFYPSDEITIYLNGTRRNFIENYFGGYLYEKDSEFILVMSGFKAAWGIQNEPYIEWSKKYNLDFMIHGYECGMQFEQEIEIIKGKLIKNEEIKYDNYIWECPFPDLGG